MGILAGSDAPSPPAANALLTILKRAVGLWQAHRAARVAAALAFYAIFALAPLTFMVVVLTRKMMHQPHALETIEGELQPILGNNGAHFVDVLVRASGHQVSSTPLIISAGLILFAGFAVFMQVQEALDDVWEIPEHRRGGVWQIIGLRLHVLIVIVVLALLALAALFVAMAAGRAAALGVNIVALAAFLTIAYRALPNASGELAQLRARSGSDDCDPVLR